MSEQGAAAGHSAEQDPLWCPFCGAVLRDASIGDGRISCRHCRSTARLDLVVSASAWRRYEWQLGKYAAALRQQAQQLQQEAVRCDAEAVRARDVAWKALTAARSHDVTKPSPSAMPARQAVAPAPEPASVPAATPASVPARSPGATPGLAAMPVPAAATLVSNPVDDVRDVPASHGATPARHRAVPVSVLLQGTGALLLLAALMIGSAVFWGVLPAWAQSALLIALVAMAGVAAAFLVRKLPTTGNVLAALTAAAGVVVSSALPRIVADLDASWFPPAAAALGAAASLLAGRRLGVRLWWHVGLCTAGISAALAIGTAVVVTELEPFGIRWSVALALLTLPVALASLAVGRAQSERDPETARTLEWIAAAGLVVVGCALVAAGRGWLLLLEDGELRPSDRVVLLGFAITVAFAGRWVARTGVWSDPARASSEVLFGASLMVLVVPNAPFSWSAQLVCAGAPVLVLWALAWTAAARSSAILAGMGVTGLLGLTAATATAPGGLDAAWFMLLVWGLGCAVTAAGWGLRRSSLAWMASAAAVMTLSWAAAWTAGHLGSLAESLVLPIAAFVVAEWVLARRFGLLSDSFADARLGQLLVLTAVLPSVIISWWEQAAAAQPVAWRLLLVVITLAAVALWSGWARSGWTVPVVAAVVVALGHTWVALAAWAAAPVEALSVSLATASVLIAAAGARDGWASMRAGVLTGLVVAVAPSVVLLLAQPAWDGLVALRLLWTSAVLAVLVRLTWQLPVLAWITGTLGLALPLWIYQTWLVEQTPVLEARTIPIAAAAAVSAGLATRMVPGWRPVPTVFRVQLGLPSVTVGGWPAGVSRSDCAHERKRMVANGRHREGRCSTCCSTRLAVLCSTPCSTCGASPVVASPISVLAATLNRPRFDAPRTRSRPGSTRRCRTCGRPGPGSWAVSPATVVAGAHGRGLMPRSPCAA